MDLLLAAVLLFNGAGIETKEFLSMGQSDPIFVPDYNLGKQSSKLLGYIILQHQEESEEDKLKKPVTLPSTENLILDYDIDSSGESNSAEYPDSSTEVSTDSESNYYHENDYISSVEEIAKLEVADLIKQSAVLRKRWRACSKQAAKICKKACTASYKEACDAHDCKNKLKKSLKKECKRNCKEFFVE